MKSVLEILYQLEIMLMWSKSWRDGKEDAKLGSECKCYWLGNLRVVRVIVHMLCLGWSKALLYEGLSVCTLRCLKM